MTRLSQRMIERSAPENVLASTQATYLLQVPVCPPFGRPPELPRSGHPELSGLTADAREMENVQVAVSA